MPFTFTARSCRRRAARRSPRRGGPRTRAPPARARAGRPSRSVMSPGTAVQPVGLGARPPDQRRDLVAAARAARSHTACPRKPLAPVTRTFTPFPPAASAARPATPRSIRRKWRLPIAADIQPVLERRRVHADLDVHEGRVLRRREHPARVVAALLAAELDLAHLLQRLDPGTSSPPLRRMALRDLLEARRRAPPPPPRSPRSRRPPSAGTRADRPRSARPPRPEPRSGLAAAMRTCPNEGKARRYPYGSSHTGANQLRRGVDRLDVASRGLRVGLVKLSRNNNKCGLQP